MNTSLYLNLGMDINQEKEGEAEKEKIIFKTLDWKQRLREKGRADERALEGKRKGKRGKR